MKPFENVRKQMEATKKKKKNKKRGRENWVDDFFFVEC